MRSLDIILTTAVREAVVKLYGKDVPASKVQLQKTRREFSGDVTLVVFSLSPFSAKGPAETAQEIGNYLTGHLNEVEGFNVIKGFLNLNISASYWADFLNAVLSDAHFGRTTADAALSPVMVEYSSPNTNKPLHLGHIRNNLLGFSISRILEASGRKVIKVNLVNDRGIHICKSMLAWQKFGNGETPESTGKKGDHLVGDYYVRFDQAYKKEVEEFIAKGYNREEAENASPIMAEAREMLRKWEAGDKEVRALWHTMNSWVYEGFDETYHQLGVNFDKIYYESETYKLGRKLVLEGLEKGLLFRKDDGSVWADLSDEGLDQKLLLRSDGTSVYMTQDLGTAHQRFTDFDLDRHIYVVGNEQNYHFQVLSIILAKLGFEWAGKLYHLSYGMVELPEGKMKSREGKVVDADDLVDEMVRTAKEMSDELGKLGAIPDEDKEKIYYQIGLGALKYFILKVDPKKNMTFNPKESIDFNGNTGPFIQYSYARIQSVLRKAGETPAQVPATYDMNEKEISLIKTIYDFPSVIQAAANEFNPALIANYLYDSAKEFNQFYHDYSILKAESEVAMSFRLILSAIMGDIIREGMYLLGIDVPERM
ncbi:MAG TPA: arginine--tRNA ligase [Bacteroidales bacterium]|nr:arginine--tRNA ligase [Bacteroidales bacterium]